MLNPFEEDKETSIFIPTKNYTENYREKKYSSNSIIKYIAIGLIYVLEIFTATLGGLNDNQTIGIFNSNLKPQSWLLASAIYSISVLCLIYQFNQRTFNNRLYFIILDFIKFSWLIIGIGILIQNKLNIFIVGYMLFYMCIEFSYLISSVNLIKKLESNSSHVNNKMGRIEF